MRFFLDTANINEIKTAMNWGVISGVTTNPTLIKNQPNNSFHEHIKSIARVINGHVSAEAVGSQADTLVEEGRLLAAIHPEIVVKLPISPEGLKAVHILKNEGIRTNVTLIFSVQQALLAAAAGASYVSPFVGRMEDSGSDGIALVCDIAEVFRHQEIDVKIVAASLRNTYHVQSVAMAGAHIATVPYAVLEQLFDHPLTTIGINRFNADWEAYRKNNG